MTTIIRPLKTAEAAAMLGIAPVTLRIWRCDGKGPRFTKLGTGKNAPVVYQLADIQAWIDDHKFQSTTGYSAAVLASAPKSSDPVNGPWQKPNG